MKTIKKSSKVIDMLLKKGCIEIDYKSSKYRRFTRPNRNDFYFVGKAGALRTGKIASKSVSLTRFLKI